MSRPVYYLSWRGHQSGPYSRDEINARFRSGEISGTHLIQVAGAWILLEEFLADSHPPPIPPVRSPGFNQSAGNEPRSADPETEMQRISRPPTIPQEQYYASPPPPALEQSAEPQRFHRVSALAVVAFVFSLGSWLFLFLWPVAATIWLLSIIFGHTAVAECRRNAHLSGRGIAIAALAISYLSVVLFASSFYLLQKTRLF
jgi:hypothetical protein